MVHRFLITVSFVCCALIIGSFAFFAEGQVSGASSKQVASIADTTAAAKSAAHHGAVRRFVDSGAKDLSYPFHSLATTSSQWGNELLILILGLLLYGVGLGYLARFSSGWS